MDLIFRNPIPVIYDALETIIDTNPIMKRLAYYVKQVLRNPIYMIMLISYGTCIVTPILFYMIMGLVTLAGMFMLVTSISGWIFTGVAIVFIASFCVLFGVFLIVGANVTILTYMLQKFGIIPY